MRMCQRACHGDSKGCVTAFDCIGWCVVGIDCIEGGCHLVARLKIAQHACLINWGVSSACKERGRAPASASRRHFSS